LRYSLEEWGRLIDALRNPRVDPRLSLALDLGGEQRLGQVIRCFRSHLELPAIEQVRGPQIRMGVLRVPGKGKKEAAPIVLTAEQRESVDTALATFLADFENDWAHGKIDDYPLFPSGRFKKGKAKVVASAHPLTRSAALGMFHQLELVAGVDHVPGRGWYGVRRVAADVAEDVEKDERVLNSITGHRDSSTRRMVYQDRERREVLDKAASARALARNKAVATSRPEPTGGPIRVVRGAKTA
jgi:integrase